MPPRYRQPLLLHGFEYGVQQRIDFSTITWGVVFLRKSYTDETDPSYQALPPDKQQLVKYANNVTVLFKALIKLSAYREGEGFWEAIGAGFSASRDYLHPIVGILVEACRKGRTFVGRKRTDLLDAVEDWIDILDGRAGPKRQPASSNSVSDLKWKAASFFKACQDVPFVNAGKVYMTVPGSLSRRVSDSASLFVNDEGYDRHATPSTRSVDRLVIHPTPATPSQSPTSQGGGGSLASRITRKRSHSPPATDPAAKRRQLSTSSYYETASVIKPAPLSPTQLVDGKILPQLPIVDEGPWPQTANCAHVSAQGKQNGLEEPPQVEISRDKFKPFALPQSASMKPDNTQSSTTIKPQSNGGPKGSPHGSPLINATTSCDTTLLGESPPKLSDEIVAPKGSASKGYTSQHTLKKDLDTLKDDVNTILVTMDTVLSAQTHLVDKMGELVGKIEKPEAPPKEVYVTSTTMTPGCDVEQLLGQQKAYFEVLLKEQSKEFEAIARSMASNMEKTTRALVEQHVRNSIAETIVKFETPLEDLKAHVTAQVAKVVDKPEPRTLRLELSALEDDTKRHLYRLNRMYHKLDQDAVSSGLSNKTADLLVTLRDVIRQTQFGQNM